MRLRAAVMVTVCLAAVPASAQQPRGSRLPSGLFGGGVGDAGQTLGLGISAGGGYSSAVRIDPSIVSGGSTFGQVAGNLQYSFVHPRVGLFANAASSASYFSGAAGQFPTRHVANAGASFNVPLSGRTYLTMGQTAAYQPLQTVSLFPGLFPSGLGVAPNLPIDPNLAATSTGYVSLTSNASLGHQLSRRTAVSLDAGYTRSGRLSTTGDLSIVRGGARLTRDLARGLTARVGYAYTRGSYTVTGQAADFDRQIIDAGIDYDRALSLTRRTTFSFGTGSAVLSDGVRTRFRLNGDARLNYDIGRSWQASVAYRRASRFVSTLAAPVQSDSLAMGVNGFVGSRVHVHSALGAARGAVGLNQGNGFGNYYSSTGLTVGLTPYVGVDVTYAYYRSDFDSAAVLTPGVPDHFERQSVRASIRLWAPLLTRVRRLNVARY